VWQSEEGRLAVVSGKVLLSELAKWANEEFGAAFGPPAIARQMTLSEVPAELTEVVRAIEEGSAFPTLQDRETWIG
jgi:hypothetical protein